MLKSLRFIPLCVLILSGYAFAEDSGNHSSDSDAAKRVAVEAAAASGVDDLLSDLKSGVNGVNKPNVNNSSGVSGAAISAYARVISETIKYHMADSLDIYQGKSCTIKIGLSRDGTVLYAVDDGGNAGLCNTALLSVQSIKKFPPPTSETLYQVFKDFRLDFKP
ncbi:TPA: cell envelope integrity protein TolA [Salmonella enterica subsp. enterica serovar Newport]